MSAACIKPLGATFSAEQEKRKKYDQLAQGLKPEFVPFVVESLGGITADQSDITRHHHSSMFRTSVNMVTTRTQA